MGGGGFAAAPHFLDIGYGPSVACTVGCTWLMYSLCMAHIWPMYDLYMAYIWPYVRPCVKLYVRPYVRPYVRHTWLRLLNVVITKLKMSANLYFLLI